MYMSIYALCVHTCLFPNVSVSKRSLISARALRTGNIQSAVVSLYLVTYSRTHQVGRNYPVDLPSVRIIYKT